jgi:hypothetical protein
VRAAPTFGSLGSHYRDGELLDAAAQDGDGDAREPEPVD